VKSYVDAQKALMDAVVKPTGEHRYEHKHPKPVQHARKARQHAKKESAVAAA